MLLYAYTIISPRLEVAYLKEWLDWMLDELEFDKVFIYDNGHDFIDNSSCQEGASRILKGKEKKLKWKKKPDVDYQEKLSNKQVDKKLRKVLKPYGDKVELIPWVMNVDHEHPYPTSQHRGYRHCVDHHPADWFFNVDPDEFVVVNKEYFNSLRDVLVYTGQHGYNCVKIGQRVFEDRKVKSPVKQLTTWGFDVRYINFKTLVRPEFLRESLQVDVHNPSLTQEGRSWVPPFELVHLNHYRGDPNKHGGSDVMKSDVALEATFNKIDITLAKEQ